MLKIGGPSCLKQMLAASVLSFAVARPERSIAQEVPSTAPAQHLEENDKATHHSETAFAIALTYNSDANADVSGGLRKGTAYLQRIGIVGDADLARAIGWSGATAHISIHSIMGTGLSVSRVGNLLTVSGIEASPALRLFNLWVEQKVGNDATVRIGQFTAGQEFAISPTARLLMNSTFGWPASFAADLPDGGPAYPISVPGARLAATIDQGRTTVRIAVFAGIPPGRDLRGLAGWKFAGQPLAIAEMARTSCGTNPAWAFVIGGWTSLDRLAAVRSATGRTYSGNSAAYAIIDARRWSRAIRTVHGFARFSISPSDRNVVDRYFDAGVTLTGTLAFRT